MNRACSGQGEACRTADERIAFRRPLKLETSDLSPRYLTIGKRESPGLQSGDAEKRICMEKDTELV
jgi:hypothetical protein